MTIIDEAVSVYLIAENHEIAESGNVDRCRLIAKIARRLDVSSDELTEAVIADSCRAHAECSKDEI